MHKHHQVNNQNHIPSQVNAREGFFKTVKIFCNSLEKSAEYVKIYLNIHLSAILRRGTLHFLNLKGNPL